MKIRTASVEEFLNNDLSLELGTYLVKLEDAVSSGRYNSFDLSNAYMTVTFCDEETIREVNAEQRDIDKVTDVLSFPFQEVKDGRLICDEADLEFDEEGNKKLCFQKRCLFPGKD